MTKHKSTTLEQDLSDDYADAENTRRMNRMENRLGKLEQRLEAMHGELGEHLVGSAQEREAAARSTTANEQAALGVLSKAQNASLRRLTPQGLLERGMRVLTDPTAVGVLESYVNGGQLKKAADLLADAEGRADREAEDGALERTESQIKEHEVLASVSRLGEQVADLQHTLNSLLSRISKLETRPQATAPAAAPTIAKAAQVRRQAQHGTDYRDSAEGLLSRLEAVIDSPAKIGHVASMIQGGDVEAARRIIEAAELHHETAMKKRDRRTL